MRLLNIIRSDAIRVMAVSRSASGQTTARGGRIRRMITAGTAVRRGASARHLLGGVTRTGTSRRLDTLLGVVFVLSSGFDRCGRAVRRGHGISAGRLYTYKTQRARISL